jgi:hypothetical protein
MQTYISKWLCIWNCGSFCGYITKYSKLCGLLLFYPQLDHVHPDIKSSLLTKFAELDKKLIRRANNTWFIRTGYENKYRVINIPVKSLYQRSQNFEAFPREGGGTGGPLRGTRVVCMRDIYFERNMAAEWNIYFYKHFVWLKYFTCHLLLVRILALDYKQHVLSPTEFIKVLFISWNLCQICLFEFIRVKESWRSWRILRGRSHKSLGASDLYTAICVTECVNYFNIQEKNPEIQWEY